MHSVLRGPDSYICQSMRKLKSKSDALMSIVDGSTHHQPTNQALALPHLLGYLWQLTSLQRARGNESTYLAVGLD